MRISDLPADHGRLEQPGLDLAEKAHHVRVEPPHARQALEIHAPEPRGHPARRPPTNRSQANLPPVEPMESLAWSTPFC